MTGFVQNGSLPVYAGVILAHGGGPAGGGAAVGLGVAGLAGVRSTRVRRRSRSRCVVAALGAAIVRRRFSAAVFLGVAGYAMAGLFVLSGAPDLALTQVAVETLSTVVFVLVLRRLPSGSSASRRRAAGSCASLIAGAVAATVFVFALIAAGVPARARRSPTRWWPGRCPTATAATSST